MRQWLCLPPCSCLTRVKQLHGGRHNHCLTSKVYREKTRHINRLLAERYGHHPALLMWHISNEYGGDCHCDLCQHAFREWLKSKYDNSLKALNHAWWTPFWSHTFNDWSQIESPSPIGEFMPGRFALLTLCQLTALGVHSINKKGCCFKLRYRSLIKPTFIAKSAVLSQSLCQTG